MAKKNEAPSWFKLADYDYCRTLDRQGWYQLLAVRLYFHEQLQWRAKREESFDRQGLWDEFRRATGNPEKWEFFPRPSEPLEEIPASMLKSPENRQGFAVWEMDLEGKKFICIDLDAADTTLKESFSNWLAEKREQYRLPVKRPGRPGKTPNIDVTPLHIDGWNRYIVPAVFDLDFWCNVFRRDRLNHRKLSGLLRPELPKRTDPKDWGREARETLKQALACVDLLALNTVKGGSN